MATALGIGLVAGLALVPTPAAGQCTAPDFEAPVAWGVGTGPQGIATADFDRDGKLDLVTADAGGNTLTVRWGDGKGGFDATVTTLTAGSKPVAIVTGDFDQNGTVDIVAALQGTQLILPYLKLTDGRGFASGSERSVANEPLAIAAGDFDRDGDLDVVTAGLSGAILFSANDGNADFTVGSGPTPLPVGVHTGVAVADFNRDGWLDVAAANRTGKEVVLLLNDKSGGWLESHFGVLTGEPEGIAAGDLDRDGWPDVVVAVLNDVGANVLLGDKMGGFAGAVSYDTAAEQTGVALADFDQNGTLDVAVAQQAAGQVVVDLGDGAGKLESAVGFPVTEGPLRLAAGDFDGDGLPDLVASGEAANQAVILVNRFGLPCKSSSFAGAGRLRVPLDGVSAMVSGDWNSDGIPDLAVAGNSTLSILTGDGTLGFSLPFNLALPASANPKSIAMADFDLDGDPDFVVSTQTPDLLVYRNAGGAFSSFGNLAVGTTAYAVVSGDFNRDGAPDLITANRLDASLTFFPGHGDLTFGSGVDPAPTFGLGGISALAAADLDGDLILDLVVTSDSTNGVQWWKGSGSGTFAFGGSRFIGTGTFPRAVAVGNLNADLLPDLAVANGMTDNVAVILNLGGGSLGPANLLAAGDGPIGVVIGDANGDGRPDLAVSNYSSGDVTLLVGDGFGSFSPSSTVPGYDLPWPVLFVDADRNGKPDVAVGHGSSSGVGGGLVVVPGDGVGGFGPVRINPGSGLRSLAAGDFDRDGVPDLFTLDVSVSNGSFLRGRGNGSFDPPAPVPTGLTLPEGLGVGDFDRNGKLDVVVARVGSGPLALLKGNGDGTFGAPTPVPTSYSGAINQAIAVGDFDRDGALDFALASSADDNVVVHFGDGAGGFPQTVVIDVGSGPLNIVTLDFNQDGILDLAVSNLLSSTISLLEGQGAARGFTPRTDLITDARPNGLAVADFDGDGFADLVVTHMGSAPATVGHFRGNGTAPSFFLGRSDYGLGEATSLWPQGIAVADVNADGLADLLVACLGDTAMAERASVRVLPGTGSQVAGAAFGAADVWTVAQRETAPIVVADFDRNGKPDFATGEFAFAANRISVVLNTNCQPRRLRVMRQVSRCNTPLTAFPTQPAVQVEDDGANAIECNSDPVGAAILPSIPLSGTNPLATVGGVADWAGAGTLLSADGTGTKYRLQFGHSVAGTTWTWPFSIAPALTITGPTEYCAANTRTFSASLGFDTYRWFVDAAGPRSYLPSLTILGGTLGGGLHNARVDAVVDTCPAIANQDFTVYASLSSVSVAPNGPYTITTAETVPVPLAVADTGGGTVAHKWGYRTLTGGLITFFPGEATPSYTIEGGDFPGQGTYYVVVETTPQCGVAMVSNEVEVQVAEATPGDVPPAFTVTSTDQQNLIEWIYPVGRDTVQIRYNQDASWAGCTEPLASTDGTFLASVTGPLGGRGSHPHTSLTNNTVYCYSIFTDTGGGTFPATTRRSVKGRPFDNTVGRVKWAFSTGASALAPPGLGAGILHVVSDETLYAVVKGGGGGMWPPSWTPFTANGPSQSRPSTVPLAVGPASRVIYLGSGNAMGNNGIAVDADTGLGLWGQPLGAPVGAGPAGIFTTYGGAYDYILLGNRNSSGGSAFFALDPTTGAMATGGWPYVGEPLDVPSNEIGVVSSQAAIDYTNPRAFFTSYQMVPGVSDSVWCVDLDTAARCSGWTAGATSSLGDLTASPTLQGGRLYVAALNGSNAEVHALDANDGSSQWGSSPFAPADGPIKLFILPDVFTHDLYFSTTDNVWSIRDDGTAWTQRWVRLLPGASQPVYFPADRLIWVGGGDGQLYTLNPNTGLDAVPPVVLGEGTAPAGAPTVDSANGFVYVGTTAGVVYAVSIP